jgi:hypothetical protein
VFLERLLHLCSQRLVANEVALGGECTLADVVISKDILANRGLPRDTLANVGAVCKDPILVSGSCLTRAAKTNYRYIF